MKPNKRSEHTIAQSKQLRDQSEQTCSPQHLLSVNTLMLKKINRKWSKIVKRIGNKKNVATIPDESLLELSFQLPFSNSPRKISPYLKSSQLQLPHSQALPKKSRLFLPLVVLCFCSKSKPPPTLFFPKTSLFQPSSSVFLLLQAPTCSTAHPLAKGSPSSTTTMARWQRPCHMSHVCSSPRSHPSLPK